LMSVDRVKISLRLKLFDTDNALLKVTILSVPLEREMKFIIVWPFLTTALIDVYSKHPSLT
jgi:hypothetical protein